MMLTQSDWDSCYQDGRTPWRDHQREYGKWLEILKLHSGSVLDLGCGTGEKSIWFAKHGFIVDAIDYSETAIRIAQAQSGLSCFHQYDLEQVATWPQLQPGYDIILDIKVLAFIQDKPKYIDTIVQHLNGTFIIEIIWHHDEHPYVAVDKLTFENLIKRRLRIVHRLPVPSRPEVATEILLLQKI